MADNPIVIVSADSDDRDALQDALKELDISNALIFFKRGEDVLDYLHTEKAPPFLILCDVRLPGMDGFELKRRIQEKKETNYKSIPFVFWSTQASEKQIEQAYDLGGNGFFIKDSEFGELKQSLTDIIQYWRKSKTPA